MLTPETLARLAELNEKATPGPWHTRPDDHPLIARSDGGGSVLNATDDYHTSNVGSANIDLAVAARNALPALLADLAAKDTRIAELEGENKELQERYERARDRAMFLEDMDKARVARAKREAQEEDEG